MCSCEWHEFIVLFGRKGSELIHLHTTYQMFLDIDQPSMHRKLSIQLWLCDLHSYGIQLLKVCDGIPFEDMKKIRKIPPCWCLEKNSFYSELGEWRDIMFNVVRFHSNKI